MLERTAARLHIQIMDAQIMLRFAALLVALISVVQGDRFAQVELSKDTAHRGDDLQVTCEVINTDGKRASVVWLRKVGEHVHEVGTNMFINTAFKDTGRYSADYQLPYGKSNYTKIIFTLNIEDVQPSESGELGCMIEGYDVNVFKNFTVLMPIRSIKMTAQDSDGSHPISFVNNGQATFEEDEERRIYCYVNGSYPVASVNMMLGEEDITHMFDKSVKLITEGEIMSTAGLSYEITLSNPAFQIKFDYMNKMLQCNAHMPGTDFPSESNGVMIKLAGFKPKFTCDDEVFAYERKVNVVIACRVVADPVLTNYSVFWEKHTEGNKTMRPGESDGHYKADIQNGSTPEESTMILKLDRVFPQHFRVYTFWAINSLGSTSFNVTLRKTSPDSRGEADPYNGVSPLRVWSSLLILMILPLLS